jgi:hypothetical protein
MCKKLVQGLLGLNQDKPKAPASENVTVTTNQAEAEVKNSDVLGAVSGAGTGRIRLGGKKDRQGNVPGLSI